MIFRELYDLALREGLVAEAGFQPAKVSYVVVVGEGGTLSSIVSTLSPPKNGKGKPVPARMSLPKDNGRTVQVEAQFLWDKAVYVFGIDPEKDEKKRRPAPWLRARQEAFVAFVKEAAEATRDTALQDLVVLLTGWLASPPTREALEALGVSHLESNSNFTFQHASDAERRIIERPAVRAWWVARSTGGTSVGSLTPCLVTGSEAIPAEIHGAIKPVPGGNTKGVSLVSFNNRAFESYGWSGNENAPISRDAADAITAALNRLLDRGYPDPETGAAMPSRRINLSADTALLFWSRGGDDALDVFSGALDADPDHVRALYEAPEQGRAPVLTNPSAFFALALSGEMARAKIRGWFQSTVGQTLSNVRQHFDDLDLVRPGDASLPVPLWRLLQALAPLEDLKRLAPDLAARLLEAVIRGTPYPRALLEHAVRRSRMEKTKVTPERAACIKAYLVRARRAGRVPQDFPEVRTHMDHEQTHVSYRLGRLFAALEKLQSEALPGLNATIRDRYFGAASATPVTVFPRLLRGAQPHVSKVKRGVYFERLIQEIVGPVSLFPSHLTLEEQGLFALGYYHQRQAFFEKKTDEAAHQEA